MSALRVPLAWNYRGKAIAALLAAALGAIGLLAGSLLGLASLVEESQTALASARHAIAASDARGAGVQSPVPASSGRLAGRTPAEAQAALQTAIKAAAGRYGATIETLQTLPNDRRADLGTLKLRVSLRLPESAFGPLLAAFATGDPLLALEGLEAQPEPASGPAESALPAGDRRLSLVLDLAGFWQPVAGLRP